MPNRMPGLVRAAGAELETRGGVNGRVSIPQGSGADALMANVSGELSRIGDRIGKMADRAAAREGQAEGRTAGLDPEFRSRQDGTIYGTAFDEAGLQVAETRLKTALETGIEEAYDAHSGDVTAVAKAMRDVTKGILKNAPQELAPGLAMLAERKTLGLVRQATREHVATVKAEQGAALQEELARSMRGMHQRAYALGLDATADAAIAGDIAELEKSLARTGINGERLVTPAGAAKLLAAARQEITEARLQGAFERLPSADAKRAFISEFEKDFEASRGLAKDFDLSGFQQMRGRFAAEMNRDQSVVNQQRALLDRQVKTLMDRAAEGFAPKPEDLAAIKAQIAIAGDPAAEQMILEAEALMKFQGTARTMPPEVLDEYTQQLRDKMEKDGATSFGMAQLKFAERLRDEAERGLKEDQLGWARRSGAVDVPQVDLNRPDTWAARIAAAEEVGKKFGRDVVYTSPDERRQIATLAAQGGDQMLTVIQGIAAGAGDRASAIFGELAMFKEAPTIGLIGRHVTAFGKTQLASDAAAGIKLNELKEFSPVLGTGPAPAAYAKMLADEVTGGSIANLAETMPALIRFTNLAFEARAAKAGISNVRDEQADELWKRTFREVLGERSMGGVLYGGIAQHNGANVHIPADVRQDRFSDVLQAIRIEDFGNDPPRTEAGPATLNDIRHATLVNVGYGKFALNVGSKESPDWLANGAGKHFILDLAALKPVIKPRIPQAFVDGGARPPGGTGNLWPDAVDDR